MLNVKVNANEAFSNQNDVWFNFGFKVFTLFVQVQWVITSGYKTLLYSH